MEFFTAAAALEWATEDAYLARWRACKAVLKGGTIHPSPALSAGVVSVPPGRKGGQCVVINFDPEDSRTMNSEDSQTSLAPERDP